jgi:hypothetical protein
MADISSSYIRKMLSRLNYRRVMLLSNQEASFGQPEAILIP